MRTHEMLRKPRVSESLEFLKNAVMLLNKSDGTRVTVTTDELAALDGLAAELALLDGILATADEVNRVADVSTRIVTIVETGGITLAANEGKTNLLAEVGGDALVTLALPEATGSGAKYMFKVGVVNTSSYIIDALTTDTLSGVIMGLADAGDTVVGWEIGAADDSIELNGSTKGGAAIGDWIEFEDILDTVWAVRGQITQTGSEETPAASS